MKPDIVNMKFGSHLYGLNTPNSDVDYKGVYLPTLDSLLLGNYAKSFKHSTGGQHQKNQAGDIDTEVMALPRFIELATQGETFAIDMLHGEPLESSDIWEDLVKNRTKFYSKNLKAFVGYVKRQAAKYGIKGSRLADIQTAIDFFSGTPAPEINTVSVFWDELPEGEYLNKIESHNEQTGTQYFYEVNGRKYQSTLTVERILNALHQMYNSYGERAKLAEQNNGVDWKAVSHALRAGYQARDIYLDGDFEYPLKETEFLLKVKTGQLDYKTEVSPVLEELVSIVEILSDNSTLPEKVDRAYWDNWLLDVYRTKLL